MIFKIFHKQLIKQKFLDSKEKKENLYLDKKVLEGEMEDFNFQTIIFNKCTNSNEQKINKFFLKTNQNFEDLVRIQI